MSLGFPGLGGSGNNSNEPTASGISNAAAYSVVANNTGSVGTATGQTSNIQLGTPSITDTGVEYQSTNSANGYIQNLIQNTSSGVAASADVVVNNNLGTSSTFYGNFGINSSTFTGTGSLALANATYLYSQSGDLVLGTNTSNAIHFVVNNGATDALGIATNGNILIGGVSNGTGVLQFPAATTSAGGITMGTDSPAVNLYRSAASTLSTDVNSLNFTQNNALIGGSAGTIQFGGSAVSVRGAATVTLVTSSTTALTLDSSQNATFAGSLKINVNGTNETFVRAGSGATNLDIGAIVSTAVPVRFYSAQALALTLDASQNALFAAKATVTKQLITASQTLTYASPTTVDCSLASCFTVTTVNATGSVTFNATNVPASGGEVTILITNDATSAKTITFGTGFLTTGTLTASAASRHTSITFKSDGTSLYETGRAVLTA